jgi:hypothetical protein
VPILPLYRTADPDDTSYVSVPLDTVESVLAPFVQKVIRALFAMSDGYAVGLVAGEGLIRRLLQR